jgi:hypothetical protein
MTNNTLRAEADRRRQNIFSCVEYWLRFVNPEIRSLPGYPEWERRTLRRLFDEIETLPDDKLAAMSDDDEQAEYNRCMDELDTRNFLLEQVIASVHVSKPEHQRRSKKGANAKAQRHKRDVDAQIGDLLATTPSITVRQAYRQLRLYAPRKGEAPRMGREEFDRRFLAAKSALEKKTRL